jgi:hypothetical protein
MPRNTASATTASWATYFGSASPAERRCDPARWSAISVHSGHPSSPGQTIETLCVVILMITGITAHDADSRFMPANVIPICPAGPVGEDRRLPGHRRRRPQVKRRQRCAAYNHAFCPITPIASLPLTPGFVEDRRFAVFRLPRRQFLFHQAQIFRGTPPSDVREAAICAVRRTRQETDGDHQDHLGGTAGRTEAPVAGSARGGEAGPRLGGRSGRPLAELTAGGAVAGGGTPARSRTATRA